MNGEAVFDLAGHEAIATRSGALLLPELATMVVADLHLEKGSSFARRGRLLPPYDSTATLRTLAGEVRAWSPRCVLCLGDSFHDGDGPTRLGTADRAGLAALAAGRTWLWITGNHDARGDRLGAAAGIGGEAAAALTLDNLYFRHEAADAADAAMGDGTRGNGTIDNGTGEISGHFHPKLSVRTRGRRVAMRCFVTNGRRLILPSFGAYTGGLDVSNPAILALVAPRFEVHAIGPARIHSFPGAVLCR